MIKHLLLLLVVSVCLAALTGCAASGTNTSEAPVGQGGTVTEQVSNFPAEPPLLYVSDGDTTVSAWRGTYSWMVKNEDGMGSGITADCMHPLDCKEGIPSLKLIKKATLTFSFEDTPSSITVRRYRLNASDYSSYEEISVIGNSIEVKTGNFLYEVIVKWENHAKPYNGTVYYAFLTEK